MTNRYGRRFSGDEKAKVVKRMMPLQNETVAKISEYTGISDVTLYKWRKEARESDTATPGNSQNNSKWNSEDKFFIVMETYSMNDDYGQ